MKVLISTAFGEVKHIQLSVWDTVQLYDASTNIHGLRLSIYGVNEDVHGIDLGIVSKVTGDFLGWQCGVININERLTVGFQTALLNKTENSRGVQLGVVNITGTLYGLQIGIINFNISGFPFKFLPIVNFSF